MAWIWTALYTEEIRTHDAHLGRLTRPRAPELVPVLPAARRTMINAKPNRKQASKAATRL